MLHFLNNNFHSLLFYLKALTANLEEALHEDEFAIVVAHIKPKKSGNRETLLTTKFTKPKTKFVVMLDRRTKQSKSFLFNF